MNMSTLFLFRQFREVPGDPNEATSLVLGLVRGRDGRSPETLPLSQLSLSQQLSLSSGWAAAFSLSALLVSAFFAPNQIALHEDCVSLLQTTNTVFENLQKLSHFQNFASEASNI